MLQLYCFEIHEFVIPLIFQDRLSPVEKYLEGSAELQKNVLSFLDGLIADRHNVTNMLQGYIQ